MIGKVKFYNVDKGYGFIETAGGDFFFHINQCPENYIPSKGDELEFSLKKTPRGEAAQNIKVLDMTADGTEKGEESA